MEKPAVLLADILAAAEAVLAESGLNPQQRTFMEHIRNNAEMLHAWAKEIPPTNHALRQIIPAMSDEFSAPQVAIMGYVDMLLQHPAQFGQGTFSQAQQIHLQTIHACSSRLCGWTEQIKQASLATRKEQRNTPPIMFDLNMLIWQHIPIYRYWIRNEDVKLTAEFPAGLPPVLCNPYHIAALVEHIVVTMACDLLQTGAIRISGALADDKETVELAIFATGIQLTDEEQQILFAQNGRQIYRERIAEQGGQLHFSHDSAGATVYIQLPLPPRLTAT